MNKQLRYTKSTILRHVCLVAGLLFFMSYTGRASHLYGADLFYTHISGNTYTVTMNVYGDCSGGSFGGLFGSSPQIIVYNGTTQYTTLNLVKQNPTNGIEVTPVCASQIGNTKCTNANNPIPGVKKYVYAANVTLNTTSTNWRFRFTGNMGSGSPAAGRSYSLTNIVNNINNPSTMQLEATLNNTNGSNSSPTYTTIPTPFFCINKAGSYNPGTIDNNNDSLVYSLTAGLQQQGSGIVTYLTGYSATAPLAVSTGSLSFNTQTGQLNFTPNLVQQSIVVNKVSEYKNGVLVGTSMREMTFVVLNNCSNNPPGGKITNNNTGKVDTNGTVINVCQSAGPVTFNINATDLDTDVINVAVSGLPAGATFNITNNNTTAPTGAFSWNVSSITPGSYNFFITYTDEGCPLASKQTIAYTVNVLPKPTVAIAVTALATCAKKAIFTMTPSVSPSPWRLQVLQGSTQVHNFNGVTGVQTDSLSPGTYTIRVTNADTCFKDTTLVIAPPPPVGISLALTPPKCHNDTNAIVVVNGTGGLAPYKYAVGSGAFSTVNTFSNQGAGLQTFKVRDSNDCVKDTLIIIPNPPKVGADIVLNQPPCNYYNSGVITVTGKNTVAPYLYAFGAGAYDTVRVFSGLFSGSYSVSVKDSNNCVLDTLVVLPDSVKVTATALLTNILCNGDSTGAITLNASGATAPYRYQLVGSGPLSPVNTFTNLPAITHNFHIEDTNKCYLDTAITLTQPTKIDGNISVSNTLCFGDSTGSITVLGNGGVAPYTYALDAGSFGIVTTFTTLPAGTYNIHIKDLNNCVRDTLITIAQPTEVKFDSVLVTNLKCYGVPGGQVILHGSGGISPYQYAVNSGAFTPAQQYSGLSATTYTFYVRDSNNCVQDTAVTLVQPQRIVPGALIKQSSCAPLNNGRIAMSATGGIPGYRYALGSGTYSTNPVFSPLAAGSYVVHVRDSNNCIVDTNIAVNDSLTVKANITVNDALCYDSSSGIIITLGSGGVAPYTYALNSAPYSALGSFGGLKANTYTVRIKDTLGCKLDTPVTVSQPTRLVPSVAASQPSCNGYSDGMVVVGATGGTPAYLYSLNNGILTSGTNFAAMKAGTHIISVIDINNCRRDTTINIGEPPGMKFRLQLTHLKCFNDSSASIFIDGSGGTPPFSYAYDQQPFVTTPTLVNVSAGPHTVKMKDGNGCIKDSTVVLTEPAPLFIVSPVITNPTCEGYTDGAVKVYGNGGVQPYFFSVNGGGFSSSNNFTGLKEGPNTVTIRDAKDCMYDTTLDLVGYPHIIYDEALADPVSCFGGSDGSIALSVSGGIQPLTYKMNPGEFGSSTVFDNLPAKEYIITVMDSAGCTKDSTIVVESPEEMKIDMKVTPNDCEGMDNTGRIDAYVSGGTPAYRYTWNTSPEQYSNGIEGMPNGPYKVIVTDANDCIDTAIATIEYNNCCIVFIPDAFTPNGDGLNELARIRYKGVFTLKTFSIYNRFGERVFETRNVDEGWNGIHKGVLQDLGTYNYFVKGICGDNQEEVMYKGTIILVR